MASQFRLNYARASWTFILAYVAITIVATGFSLAIDRFMHFPPANGPVFPPPAYLFAERFFPLLNLAVWMVFGWVYFRSRIRRGDSSTLQGEALALGAFWLVGATVVDYVGFVKIKNPISLSPHDFYVGQFPWIYLIYLTILIAPVFLVMLAARAR
jgi:hypothetical protein